MFPSPTRPSPAGLVEIEALRNHIGVYRDRRHAGQLLAHVLAPYLPPALQAFAIPTGGVCVAAPIAEQLGTPLGLILTSRVRTAQLADGGEVGDLKPLRPSSGIRHIDRAAPARGAELERQVDGAQPVQREAARLAREFDGRVRPRLDGGVALVIDHGLASGVTMIAAVQAVRRAGAQRVWVAVPTAHERTLRDVLPQVEGIFCPNVRTCRRFSIADAYERCSEIDEAHTLAHLRHLEHVAPRH